MKQFSKKTVSIIGFLIIGGFVLGKLHPGNVAEPTCQQYTTDEKIYLKTYYLVKQGTPYHQALSQAVVCEAGQISLGSDIFTWRPPLLFYLWAFATPTASEIKMLFWALVLVSGYCWLTVIKKQSNSLVALASLACIAPYFIEHYFYPTGFLMTEWWAIFVVSFCCYFFANKKSVAAILFLTAGVMIRELLIIPFGVIAVYYGIKKNNRLLIAGCTLLLMGYYAFHIANINHLVGEHTPFSITQTLSRFHLPEKMSLWRMSAFFTQIYPLLSFQSVRILWLCGVAALCLRLRYQTEISLVILSQVVILPWIVTGAWTDYWGILLIPLPLLFAPLLPYYLLRKKL